MSQLEYFKFCLGCTAWYINIMYHVAQGKTKETLEALLALAED